MFNLASIRRFSIERSGAPEDWQKVFAFIIIWGAAVVFALSRITASNIHDPPLWDHDTYTLRYGYTYSLILLVVPLLGLSLWYYLVRRYDKDGRLKALMRAVVNNTLLTGILFVVFDAIFASLLFDFPDPRSVLHFRFPGYTWKGDCSTIWHIYRLTSCYEKTIPYEEVAFYLLGAAVLRGMYLWASEDFLVLYTMEHSEYMTEARRVKRLLSVNWRVVALMAAILAAGIWFKHRIDGGGYPTYLLLETLIISSPMVFLYTRVRPFINTRALLMVIVLQVLVSLIWEVTAALPYGWWSYERDQMIGKLVNPWSDLPIEACLFWIAVGWSAMFAHESTKIKVRSGRSWWSILTGHGFNAVPAVEPPPQNRLERGAGVSA